MRLTLLLSLFLALSAVTLQGQSFDQPNVDLLMRPIYTYADRVNIRTEPNLDSKVIATLPLGTPLISPGNGSADTIDGMAGVWREVWYEGEIAYVWGNLVSFTSLRSNQDHHSLILVQSSKPYQLGVRLIRSGKLTQELVIDIPAPQYYYATLSHLGSGGIEGLQDLLVFEFKDSDLPQLWPRVFVGYDGKRLHHIFTEEVKGDKFSLERTRLVLPYEPQGEKGVILRADQKLEMEWAGDYSPYPTMQKILRDKQTQLRWNGDRLVEVESLIPRDLRPMGYIFGDNVNIRESPSLDSPVLATLAEGTPYYILEAEAKEDVLNGKRSHWHKIDHAGKPGYVWAPLVAKHAPKSQFDSDYLFLFGSKVEGKAQVKVFHRGKKVQTLEFQISKQSLQETGLASSGSYGVVGVKDLFHLSLPGFGCGLYNEEIQFAFDGKKLHLFFQDGGIGDGGFFETNFIVLPNTPTGRPDQILQVQMAGEHLYGEDESGLILDRNQVDRMRWIGSELVRY